MADQQEKILTVSSSPHLSDGATSRRVMFEVVIGTLPAVLAAIWFFGGKSVSVLVSCLVACVATEWVFNAVRKKPQTIDDGSAIVTALILGLSLPPGFPWWAAVVGSVVSIGVAKMLFGGLGANIFNPAMVGRAFLMACFGTMMTTWAMPISHDKVDSNGAGAVVRSGVVSGKVANSTVAAVSQPTPLAVAKQVIRDAGNADVPARKKASPQGIDGKVEQLFLGDTGGSLGETSSLCWLIGGIFLLIRRTITWEIPVMVLGSAGLIATFAWWMNPNVYVNPLVHLFGGGLMMCAFFIATDMVTCPLSKWGRILFGIGVGGLVMLIRLKGGYPEGVMYAILLMNSITPLLDRWTRPTPLGGHVPVRN